MKKKILIKGSKVHGTGYRLFLMNMAGDFGIENFDAKNLKEDGTQAVQVLVESSEENIQEFFSRIKNEIPEHAKVESFRISDYSSAVKRSDSFRVGFTAAQQQKFVDAGIAMLSELNGIKPAISPSVNHFAVAQSF